MKEQTTKEPEASNDTNSKIITVTVLGFSRTQSGLRLNTSPALDIWVNSKKEYAAYQELVGKEANFAPRVIRTRAGTPRKVFDLNLDVVGEAELEELFNTDFAEEEAVTTGADRPF